MHILTLCALVRLCDCEPRLVVICVCIATITPEDGRVVDETSLSLDPECDCFGCREGLKQRALGPH